MIKRKITFYAFCGLLVSSVLAKKLLPIFVIALVVVWLWERDFANKWKTLKNNSLYILLPFYYAILLLGFIHTENVSYGLQKMETRLPLLLLPVILPTLKSLNFSYHKRTFTRVFIFTILAAMLICLAHGTYLYILEVMAVGRGENIGYLYKSRYFFGTVFSHFLMHPGYLAMYANMAIIIVLFDLKKIQTRKRMYYNISVISALTIFVVLLYSKTGIAALLFIFMAFGARYAYLEKKVKYLVLSLGLIAVLGTVVYYFVPHTQTRVETIIDVLSVKNHNPNSIESTQLRVHAWKASRMLIEEAPVFGHGTGDAWDVLAAKYQEKQFNGALGLQVNSHNEYYQTALAVGLVGAAFLIFTLLFWFIVAIRKRHFPLALWTIITSFVFTFESYFSTQDGVVYTSLFLFFVYSLKSESHE